MRNADSFQILFSITNFWFNLSISFVVLFILFHLDERKLNDGNTYIQIIEKVLIYYFKRGTIDFRLKDKKLAEYLERRDEVPYVFTLKMNYNH